MRNGPYILVVASADYPGKRYRGRYCYEHQLVWWQNTGEVVENGWLVHHKNEDKHDNRFENLEKKTVAAHTAEHKYIDSIVATCGWCVTQFDIKPSVHRFRVKQTQTKLYCTRSCQVKKQQYDLRIKRCQVAQR